jgi:ribosomal protein S21
VVEVRKKERETIEALLRRFKKQLQRSGVLYMARKRRFYEPLKSKRQKRDEAARRTELQKEKDHLRKLGKLNTKFTSRGKYK